MKIMTRNPTRRKHLIWSRKFREETTYMSLVPRPQTVRMIYLKEKHKEKEE